MRLLKQQLDQLSYDDILKQRYSDLKYHRREWCGDITIDCTFSVSKAVFESWKRDGYLGQIYNCDLSNYLHRMGVLDFYAVPTVNDKQRCKNGRKTIHVSFVKRSAR